MVGITNNLASQQVASAFSVSLNTTAAQDVPLQRHNIQAGEQNKSFLHSPQVRSAGIGDLGKPQALQPNPTGNRGTQVNINA